MTQDIFLSKRKKMLFTIEDVNSILKDLGYSTCLLQTHCEGSGKWSNDAVKEFREELGKLNLTYFAYIKFYINKKNNDNKYALVAGKTNSWNDDVYFEDPNKYKDKALKNVEDIIYERKDKAKIWLATTNNDWYPNEVLVVWRPELIKAKGDKNNKDNHLNQQENLAYSNLAYSIESDIGGLLGLFSS